MEKARIIEQQYLILKNTLKVLRTTDNLLELEFYKWEIINRIEYFTKIKEQIIKEREVKDERI